MNVMTTYRHYVPRAPLMGNYSCRSWQPAKPHYPGHCAHPDPETAKIKCILNLAHGQNPKGEGHEDPQMSPGDTGQYRQP